MPPDLDHDVACAFPGCLHPDGFIVFTVAILAQGTSWAGAATQAFCWEVQIPQSTQDSFLLVTFIILALGTSRAAAGSC